jgi:hypothetical protein
MTTSFSKLVTYKIFLLFQIWVDIVGSGHFMDPQVRQIGSHVEFESDTWRRTFPTEQPLLEGAFRLAAGFSSTTLAKNPFPPANFHSALRIISDVLYRLCSKGMKTVTLGGYKVLDMTISSPHLTSGVSFHIPLHRVLCHIVHSAIMTWTNVPIKDIINDEVLPNPDFLLYMVEYPVQIQALLSQLRAGMWKRNGSLMETRVRVYKNSHFKLLELDLLLLQIGKLIANSL